MALCSCVALNPQGCGFRRFVRDARFAGSRGIIARSRGRRQGGLCTRAGRSGSSLSCLTPLRVQAGHKATSFHFASVFSCLQRSSANPALGVAEAQAGADAFKQNARLRLAARRNRQRGSVLSCLPANKVFLVHLNALHTCT